MPHPVGMASRLGGGRDTSFSVISCPDAPSTTGEGPLRVVGGT